MKDVSLVRVPKSLESAPEAIRNDLRLKSWAVSRSIPLRTTRSPELGATIAELALSCHGLLEFGWSALEAE